ALHRCDLMLAERLAHDVEAARQRCIAKGAFPFSRPRDSNRGGERLFGGDELGLGLSQGRGKSPDRLTGSLHGSPPFPGHQSSLRLILSALLAPHVRSLLWHPRELKP